jgi:hypothetical protein
MVFHPCASDDPRRRIFVCAGFSNTCALRVTNKNRDSSGLFLYKIADCMRTDFRPYAIGDPHGRNFVRAKKRSTA